MLDPRRERERLREERKRRLVRILKWKPRGGRQWAIYWALLVPALFGGGLLGTLVIGPCIRG